MEELFKAMADALGVGEREAVSAARRRVVRVLEYRGVQYASFRKDFQGIPEGSIFLYSPRSREYLFLKGYPSIKRIALPSVALPKWFIDRVAVEEKMDGYNVRVVLFDDKVLAITRGGLVCPYTSARIERVHGDRIRSFFSEYDPREYYLAGEVVGLENPYTRYFYPEAPRFAYYVFDLFRNNTPQPLKERDEAVEKHGLLRVRVLGVIDKNDIDEFHRIVRSLEEEGREGVVVKDPYYRVAPLKYTTSAANIGDLEHGMRFFFEEGRSFLFSRILREIFKSYEEGVGEAGLRAKAEKLGYSILAPALETVRSVAAGHAVYEEFQLEFAGREELEEFLEYMERLGVDIVVYKTYEREGMLVAVVRKMKDTWLEVKRILETGLSPLD